METLLTPELRRALAKCPDDTLVLRDGATGEAFLLTRARSTHPQPQPGDAYALLEPRLASPEVWGAPGMDAYDQLARQP